MTLYTQVAHNRTKTWLFLSLYLLLLWAVAYAISSVYGDFNIFLIVAPIVMIQGIIAYWFSDKVALAASKAKPLDQKKFPEIYRLVENLSITAGLPMPRLYLIDDTAINAFATGRNAKNAAIAVTRGLTERLDKNEIQGVLAHELSHIGNEDIRLMGMVMVMAGLIALVSDIFLRSMWLGGGRRRNNNGGDGNAVMLFIAIGLAILAPIAATLIQLAISRKREYMADANGVLLTRYPEGLISALHKIGGDEESLEVANRGNAHMYFSNPLHGGMWLSNLFSTHPKVEDRVKALKKGSGLEV